jgi:GTP-binding protein lepA|nr:MAG TPA: hypothetical protein [Caudoviricetes sp.]
MTYKVLKSLVYGGIAYTEGQEVDIIEKSVAENCLERELIAEITDTETSNVEVTENNEDNEDTTGEEDKTDKTEEVVSSETDEETTENVEEPTKTNKRNKK